MLTFAFHRQEEKKKSMKREIKDAKVQELQEKLEARKAGNYSNQKIFPYNFLLSV